MFAELPLVSNAVRLCAESVEEEPVLRRGRRIAKERADALFDHFGVGGDSLHEDRLVGVKHVVHLKQRHQRGNVPRDALVDRPAPFVYGRVEELVFAGLHDETVAA